MSIFSKTEEEFSFSPISIPDAATIEGILSTFNDLDKINDYRDFLIIVLSAIANQDDELTVAEARAYEDAIISCVDEDYINDPISRLKFFSCILSPVKLSSDLANRFLTSIQKDELCKSRRSDIANALVTILEGGNVISSSDASQFVKRLIDSFDIPTSEYSSRLDALQEKNKKFGIPSRASFSTESVQGKVVDLFRSISDINLWKKGEPGGLADVGTIRGILNEKAIKKIRAMKIFSEEIDDSELLAQVVDFSSRIKPGKFRIVLCGEVKHGKSSVFNLLAGSEISPVGESVAMTAASIELYYSPQPTYHGQWICESDLQRVDDYFESKNDDPIISIEREKVQSIRGSMGFTPGGTIESIGSKPEMLEYTTTRGRSALLIQKVFVGLPLPYLEKGAVIIDTPGLNDPFQLREKITIDDAKQAHCVVFVMRADKFGTNSERTFLINLLREGAAIKLVVVITHVDHLASSDSAKKLMSEAWVWLESVTQEAGVGNLLGDIEIFGFDAHFDVTDRALIEGRGYSEFVNHLQKIARQLHASGDYEAWVEERIARLDVDLQQQAKVYLMKVDHVLEQENEFSGLTSIKGVFENLTKTYSADTASRLNEYRARLRLDYEELMKGLEDFKRLFIHSLSESIEKKVDALGDDYDLDRKWESFNQSECEFICKRELNRFKSQIEKKIEFWNETFVSFSQEEHQKLRSSAMDLMNSQKTFANMCATSATKERIFNTIDRGINRMKDATIFLTGATASSISSAGPVVVLSALTVLLNSTWALPALGLSAGAIWAIKRHIGTKEQRKKNFREIMVAHAIAFIDERVDGLKDSLKEDVYLIDRQLMGIAERHCNPVLMDSYATLKEIDLRLELLNRIRNSERQVVDSRINHILAIS